MFQVQAKTWEQETQFEGRRGDDGPAYIFMDSLRTISYRWMSAATPT